MDGRGSRALLQRRPSLADLPFRLSCEQADIERFQRASRESFLRRAAFARPATVREFSLLMTAAPTQTLALRKTLFALVLAFIALSIVLPLLDNRQRVVPDAANQLKTPTSPSL